MMRGNIIVIGPFLFQLDAAAGQQPDHRSGEVPLDVGPQGGQSDGYDAQREKEDEGQGRSGHLFARPAWRTNL